MNTAIIYGNSDSITDNDFLGKINAISKLLCPQNHLSLFQIGGNNDFTETFKKASANNRIVFLTPSVFENNKSFFEKYLKSDFLGFYKGRLFSCLPDNDRKFYHIIGQILESSFKTNEFCAVDYIDINEISFKEVYETVAAKRSLKNPHLYVFENDNSVRILVTAKSHSQSQADSMCTNAIKGINLLFTDNAFSNDFKDISDNVVKALKQQNLKIATAESCTAGMLSAAITSVPGSSDVFEIGISSYADRIKKAALGVSANTLKLYGAVSMQTAIEMAHGIKTLSGADIGISATGVAGPSHSESKPVGTVFIALTDGIYNWVIDLNLNSNLSRDQIRKKTTYNCLDLLRRYLLYYPEPMPYGAEVSKPPKLLYMQPHFETEFNNFKVNIFEETPVSEIKTDFNEDLTENITAPDENKPNNKIKIIDSLKILKQKLLDLVLRIKPILKDRQKLRKIALNCLLILLISSFVIGSITVYSFFSKSNNNSKLIASLSSVSNADNINFNALNEINPDICGWITVGKNKISLPVCYDGGDYYKNHNYKRHLSDYGSIYSLNGLTSDCKNMVIKGNSPFDNSMFGELNSYKSLDFLKQNGTIKLSTTSFTKTYQIFAVMLIDENEKQDFSFYGTDFTNLDKHINWINNIKLRSLYKFDSLIPADSQYVTLVTDSKEFDGAKIVVIAFSVTEDMQNNNYPEMLSVNASPFYPTIWYKIHNSRMPVFDINKYAGQSPFPANDN